MTTNNENYFARLNAIDVSAHVERKGQFNYLSWAWAVKELRLAEPTATWEVKRWNGIPFLATEVGYFVEVSVTVQNITLAQVHPVLDGKNRPLISPSSFDVNTSIARCLVKCIALHGLGLALYSGDDLSNLEVTNIAEISSPPSRPLAVVKTFPKRDNGFTEPEQLTENQLRCLSASERQENQQQRANRNIQNKLNQIQQTQQEVQRQQDHDKTWGKLKQEPKKEMTCKPDYRGDLQCTER